MDMYNLGAMRKEELLALHGQTKLDIAKHHNFQLAKKIQLNSAYGAL